MSPACSDDVAWPAAEALRWILSRRGLSCAALVVHNAAARFVPRHAVGEVAGSGKVERRRETHRGHKRAGLRSRGTGVGRLHWRGVLTQLGMPTSTIPGGLGHLNR